MSRLRNPLGVLVAGVVAVGLGVVSERSLRLPMTDSQQSHSDSTPAPISPLPPDVAAMDLMRSDDPHKVFSVQVEQMEHASLAELPALVLAALEDEPRLDLLCQRWAFLDPTHMCQAFVEPPLAEHRGVLWYYLMREWPKSDIAAAWRASDELGSPEDHTTLTVAGLESDSEQTVKELIARGGLDTGVTMGPQHWTTRVPEEAGPLLATLPHCQFRSDALGQVSKNWYFHDREKAVAWIRSLPMFDQETLSMGLAHDLRFWNDGDVALRFAEEAKSPVLRASLLDCAPMDRLVETLGSETVLEWLAQNVSGRSQLRLYEKAFVASAPQNLARTLDEIEARVPSAARRYDLARNLARNHEWRPDQLAFIRGRLQVPDTISLTSE